MAGYAFTVFTPTYNRRHTLAGVYQSLRAQTFSDFEWIIVDDGSSDHTCELIGAWQSEASFPIRYFYQPNCGKHVAHNRAVKEAKGELFLIFDSDDRCVPEALERFQHHWLNLPSGKRDAFSTITALCMTNDGTVLGPEFPAPVLDATSPSEQMRWRRDERWGVNRTDVLRMFPYPEIQGEKFIAEGLVWTRMSLAYGTRVIAERLKRVEYRSDGLTAASLQIRVRNPVGARLYYKESIAAPMPLTRRVRDAINYCRFSFHAGISWRCTLTDSAQTVLVALCFPAGLLSYGLDLIRLHSRRAPQLRGDSVRA